MNEFTQGIGALSSPQQMPQGQPQPMPMPMQQQPPPEPQGIGINLIKVQDQLKDLSDMQLTQSLAQGSSAPPALVLAELNRRKRMREGMAQAPQATVADELMMAAMPQPQPMPMPPAEGGLAALPVGEGYASGGIVSFADGGDIDRERLLREEAARRNMDPTELLMLMEQAGMMPQPEAPRTPISGSRYGMIPMERPAEAAEPGPLRRLPGYMQESVERAGAGVDPDAPLARQIGQGVASPFKQLWYHGAVAPTEYIKGIAPPVLEAAQEFGSGLTGDLIPPPIPALTPEQQAAVEPTPNEIARRPEKPKEEIADTKPASMASGIASVSGMPKEQASSLANELAKSEKAGINWPLVMAGLAMMSSERPDFLGALGEGGIAGFAAKLKQDETAAKEREGEMDRELEREKIAATLQAANIRASGRGGMRPYTSSDLNFLKGELDAALMNSGLDPTMYAEYIKAQETGQAESPFFKKVKDGNIKYAALDRIHKQYGVPLAQAREQSRFGALGDYDYPRSRDFSDYEDLDRE